MKNNKISFGYVEMLQLLFIPLKRLLENLVSLVLNEADGPAWNICGSLNTEYTLCSFKST